MTTPSASSAVSQQNARPVGLVALGVNLGALTYTSTFVEPIFPGAGDAPPDPYVNRGGFLGMEARYAVADVFELAARMRIGWLQRGPPTVVKSFDSVDPEGADFASLDPQLGDPNWGGSAAILMRLLPRFPMAFDLGWTVAVSSFRMRLAGAGVAFQSACGDCYKGQDGSRAYAIWPTLRISRAGYGFFYSVSLGEPFVRTHEPGVLEILLGYRSEWFGAMAGVGSGLGLRVEAGPVSGCVISADVSYKPWGEAIDGVSLIGVLTVTRRLSGYAAF